MNLEGWGVTPQGFRRPPMSVIKAWVETDMMTVFGPDVIQTAQTPLGQYNGLMIETLTRLFEFAEQIYLSNDPDQAEGIALDILGRIRLLQRGVDETEEDFRRAISNNDRARVDVQDLVRAVRNVAGVTYVEVFLPEDGQLDEFTVPPMTVAIAVEGGDDQELATVIRDYLVPGVNTFGNASVTGEIDGLCRTFHITRPVATRVTLQINVRTMKDRNDCAPPATSDMRRVIAEEMNLRNGEDITYYKLRILERYFPDTVEVIDFRGAHYGETLGTINEPVNITFTQRAYMTLADVSINVVS